MSVSSLRAQLAQVEARNRELHGYMYELSSGVSQAERKMSNVEQQTRSTLANSTNQLEDSHQRMIRAHEVQAQIDALYVRFKHMELANKKIREANNRKYYDFSTFNTVRKIVQGMLDNLNLHMVSDATIYKAIEKEHLKTPNYWLTTVLISVMGWKSDDRKLAEHAIEIAMRLDKKNASIFYMLFNIRMGREEAAIKWFRVYQECELTGDDEETFLMLFSMLSQTVKNNVDDSIKYEVIEFINRTMNANIHAEGYDRQNVVNQIQSFLYRMRNAEDLQLNMLQRCLRDYNTVANVVACAAGNVQILQFVLDVGNVSEAEKNEYIDQFLKDEVNKPNSEEQSVYDEIARNELIIEKKGDVETAERIFNERMAKRENRFELVQQMIHWIYQDLDGEGVNAQVRKNMFSLTLDLQMDAYHQYVENYRRQMVFRHPAILGDYSTEVDFNNRQGESMKIRSFYEEARQNQLKEITNIPAIIGAVLAVLGVAGVFFLTPWTLILSGIGAICVAYNFIGNSRQRKQIEETCDLNIRSKDELMTQLFNEFGQLMNIFQDYDAYAARVEDELRRF